MGILIGLLAIATLAAGQTVNNPKIANPRRFMANDVCSDGDITHLRGNVLMKTQSAIIHADGENILPQDLPDRLRNQDPIEESDIPQAGTFERLIRDYKVKLATRAIEDCNGNKTLAARSLNISRAYLHRLIRLDEATESTYAA